MLQCITEYLSCGGKCPADIHTHCLFLDSLGPSGPQRALKEQAPDSGCLEDPDSGWCLELALNRCKGVGGQVLLEEGGRQGTPSSQLLGWIPGRSPWMEKYWSQTTKSIQASTNQLEL